MLRFVGSRTHFGVLGCLLALGVLTSAIVLPYRYSSYAASSTANQGLMARTESAELAIPNFDIRTHKGEKTAAFLAAARGLAGKTAARVAEVSRTLTAGEQELRARNPHAKVEYNDDLRIPEVITPNVWGKNLKYLSNPSKEKHPEILRNFVKQNDALIGVDKIQADELVVTADYTNPDGNLSFTHLEQQINGIPVFRGEVKAGFTKDGQIVRVINGLVPDVDYNAVPSDFRDPMDAVLAAGSYIDHEFKADELAVNAAKSDGRKSVFGSGDWATTAEKMYFPTEPGVAIPAWRVLIWEPTNAYYVIVDAATGTLLWRKNLSNDQLQSAQYQVYRNANSYIDVADSPAPFSPGPLSPLFGSQGNLSARSMLTQVGNEGSLWFNSNGWIQDGSEGTDGNAVQAGIDRDGLNGVDAPQLGSPSRTFTSTWNPPPGSPAPGDQPLTAQAQRGAVIQMFYAMNRYHDEMYKRGFTEAARNFQAFNFGRGGTEGDRISAEAQDSSGVNNASFATAADGVRGRMQMYIWNGPSPNRDGTADAEVIFHEATHGMSNRLHGNGSGLLTNMAGGMGEGWSDWYAETLLAEPTDNVNGLYTIAGYSTYLNIPGFTGNYYYGIRRFPRAPITTVGPNGRPHNPFTFKHLNTNCDSTLGTPLAAVSSAFPRSPIVGTAGNCDQVHNAGEIWSSALWEMRVRMINRLGFANGTTRALQVVTDAMKMSSVNPTFLQGRDSIIAAAALFSTEDAADVREGFRVRGMGYSASIEAIDPAYVTEAYDRPNARASNPIIVNDAVGNNNGYAEPGENITISVPVTDPMTGVAITNVVANVNGGPNVNYGTIPDGVTVVRELPFKVPATASCGGDLTVNIYVSSDAGTLPPTPFTFKVGKPILGAPIVFTNSAPIAINDYSISTPYPSTINVSGLSGFKNVKVRLNRLSHTFPSDIDILLVGPGGQKMEIWSDQGSGTDIISAELTLTDTASNAIPSFVTTGEYRPTADDGQDPFPSPAPAGPYSLPGPGGSSTLGTTFGSDGAALNGAWKLYIVDDTGVDAGNVAGGWSLVFESSSYQCTTSSARKAPADFDGDGKSDVSVFRASDGQWYQNRSTAGFTGVKWGSIGDVPLPGDYDGDGKADFAVWRPSDASGVPDVYVLSSSNFTVAGYSHGSTTDIPVTGDYDGDGRSDVAVWRPSNGTWYVLSTGTFAMTTVQFGSTGDVPFTMDREGDGMANLAVFRSSSNTWYIARASGNPSSNFEAIQWGSPTDTIAPGDYDGDGKADVAVFRPSNGVWFILRSSDSGVTATQFGTVGDIAVPGDYDGDGKIDPAVYRGGIWYINRSTAGFTALSFGISGDIPIPAKYHP